MRQIVNAEAVTKQELCDQTRVEVILNAYAAGVAEYAPLGAAGRRVLEGFLVRQFASGGSFVVMQRLTHTIPVKDFNRKSWQLYDREIRYCRRAYL
jgi:hypothetical protein